MGTTNAYATYLFQFKHKSRGKLEKKFITMIFFMKMSEAAIMCGSERLQESLDAVYGEQKHEKAHTGHGCMQINGF